MSGRGIACNPGNAGGSGGPSQRHVSCSPDGVTQVAERLNLPEMT
jgi:hypothetical protein